MVDIFNRRKAHIKVLEHCVDELLLAGYGIDEGLDVLELLLFGDGAAAESIMEIGYKGYLNLVTSFHP